MSNPFTVIAEFSVSPASYDAFFDLCLFDSRHSLADEEGCICFDVLTDNADKSSIVLHETYTDQAAFDAHLQTPHFAKFAKTWKELEVEEKRVRFFTHRAPAPSARHA